MWYLLDSYTEDIFQKHQIVSNTDYKTKPVSNKHTFKSISRAKDLACVYASPLQMNKKKD